MDYALDESLDDIADAAVARPVAIWLGLVGFFLGSVLFGNALASAGTRPFGGPLLMLLGVALVGGGFTMAPTGLAFDPDIEFSGLARSVIVGCSSLFVVLAALVLIASLV